MIRRLMKLIWSVVVLAFVGYLVFFVELGDKTFFQHALRIMQTDEAKELRQEVGDASKRATKKIREQVTEGRAKDRMDAGGVSPVEILDGVRQRLREVGGQEIKSDGGIPKIRAAIESNLKSGHLLLEEANKLKEKLDSLDEQTNRDR